MKCAAAGKDVFCEKPIATDLPETIEAIRVCEKAGIKLMTALQRRFDPNFARVKRAIVSGEVGAAERNSVKPRSRGDDARVPTLQKERSNDARTAAIPQVGEPITIKLCSRDPSPPPFEYRDRAEILPVGPGVAMYFKKTTPAFRPGKNHRKRPSPLRVSFP